MSPFLFIVKEKGRDSTPWLKYNNIFICFMLSNSLSISFNDKYPDAVVSSLKVITKYTNILFIFIE